MKRIACVLLMLALLTAAGFAEAADAGLADVEQSVETAEETPEENKAPEELPDEAEAAAEETEQSIEAEKSFGIGERFMSLDHIFAISAAGNGTADIFFETLSEVDRPNPGMVMIYKFAEGDRFPVMSLSFMGEPDANGEIERILFITDEHIYDFAQDSFAACQQSDYRLYLNANGGNVLMSPDAADMLREFLASENGAIAVGNRHPYCVYELTEDERALLRAVVDEWDGIWNAGWYAALAQEDRDVFEKVFPRADVSRRTEDDLHTLLEGIYYEPYPELARKSRGVEVELLQEALTAIGCDIGSVDGVFGEHTEEAVKDVQTFLGYDPTGIADDITQRAIYKMRDEGSRIDGAQETQDSVALDDIDVYSLDIALDEALPSAKD